MLVVMGIGGGISARIFWMMIGHNRQEPDEEQMDHSSSSSSDNSNGKTEQKTREQVAFVGQQRTRMVV
jgi:hypothetical protein